MSLFTTPSRHIVFSLLLWGLLPLIGCDQSTTHQNDADMPEAVTLPPGVIELTPTAQKNLGITYAQAIVRPYDDALVLPGQFTADPDAQQLYVATLPGTIEWHVRSNDFVRRGEVLYTLKTTAFLNWRQDFQEAVAAGYQAQQLKERNVLETASLNAEITRATAERDAHIGRIASLASRLQKLAEAGAKNAALQAEHDAAVAQRPVFEAAIVQAEAAHSANAAAIVEAEIAETRAAETRDIALRRAHAAHAQLNGNLSGPAVNNADDIWPTIVKVRAKQSGIVQARIATEGEWLDAGATILRMIDPTHLRFHVNINESDLAELNPSRTACVRPYNNPLDADCLIDGQIEIAPQADTHTRTVAAWVPVKTLPDVLDDGTVIWPVWPKAGLSGEVSLARQNDGKERLVIPTEALIKDGAEWVFFRQLPSKANQVKRVVANIGVQNAQWTEIKTGIKAGDQIVVSGAYALNLASSNSTPKAPPGYHYHADGTLHADDAP